MAERWQQWMPLHIDKFRGSPEVQAMHPAARIGYLYLLASAWQTDDCMVSSDPVDLATASGLGDELWAQYGARILRKFESIDGRLRNEVLFREWKDSKAVYEKRQKAARDTNTARSAHGDRAVTDGKASRSADTQTLTGTGTITETGKEVSKTSSPHPGASLGVAKTIHPDLAIYQAYPRKEGKGAALEAIRKAVVRLVKGEAPHDPMPKLQGQRYLMRRVLEYEHSPVGKQPDKSKIPHPATWFNQKRYDDDQANWHRTERNNGNQNYSKTDGNLDAAAQAIAFLEQADRDRQTADHLFPQKGSGDKSCNLGNLRAGPIEVRS